MADISKEEAEARARIKEIYEDGFVEINGRIYEFQKTNHSRRTEVFSYFTSIQHLINAGNFSFLTSQEFKKIWGILENTFIMFDGMQLSKLNEHWEEYDEDYLKLIMTVFGVMSYPFTKGAATS